MICAVYSHLETLIARKFNFASENVISSTKEKLKIGASAARKTVYARKRVKRRDKVKCRLAREARTPECLPSWGTNPVNRIPLEP